MGYCEILRAARLFGMAMHKSLGKWNKMNEMTVSLALFTCLSNKKFSEGDNDRSLLSTVSSYNSAYCCWCLATANHFLIHIFFINPFFLKMSELQWL